MQVQVKHVQGNEGGACLGRGQPLPMSGCQLKGLRATASQLCSENWLEEGGRGVWGRRVVREGDEGE